MTGASRPQSNFAGWGDLSRLSINNGNWRVQRVCLGLMYVHTVLVHKITKRISSRKAHWAILRVGKCAMDMLFICSLAMFNDNGEVAEEKKRRRKKMISLLYHRDDELLNWKRNSKKFMDREIMTYHRRCWFFCAFFSLPSLRTSSSSIIIHHWWRPRQQQQLLLLLSIRHFEWHTTLTF